MSEEIYLLLRLSSLETKKAACYLEIATHAALRTNGTLPRNEMYILNTNDSTHRSISTSLIVRCCCDCTSNTLYLIVDFNRSYYQISDPVRLLYHSIQSDHDTRSSILSNTAHFAEQSHAHLLNGQHVSSPPASIILVKSRNSAVATVIIYEVESAHRVMDLICFMT